MLKTKIGSALASAALFASVFAPAASAANVNIGGNGAFSYNWANVNKAKTTIVSQSNTTAVSNHIGSNANSGNNSSMFNTGSTSGVVSGAATSNVATGVAGGHNNALLVGCGCVAGASTINIGGNGAYSVNGVNMNSTEYSKMIQHSTTAVSNNIGSNANSGNNSSSFNTGGGSTVMTSPATSNVTTVVTGGNNNLTSTP